ncbi:hypothetical protein J6590_009835 [Homalodisca vitripennis]|nr:hypothetical protein J6590_009835 [Homalodisca vitripennis]
MADSHIAVLQVLDIEGSGEKEGRELVLSDGWYSVTASIDREMSLMVRRSVVRVGTKLLVVGADLINNEDGCHPLEVLIFILMQYDMEEVYLYTATLIISVLGNTILNLLSFVRFFFVKNISKGH